MNGKSKGFGVTGQWGIRRTGKRAGTAGYISRYESKLQRYDFAGGTVWATSLRGAKIKLKSRINGLILWIGIIIKLLDLICLELWL